MVSKTRFSEGRGLYNNGIVLIKELFMDLVKKNVAVIITVYKGDKFRFFEEAMNSLVSQTYDIDIFLFQDGPVAEELKNKINGYSRLNNVFLTCSVINVGLARGLNILIEKVLASPVQYKYIARMDSDDISHIDRIKTQVEFMSNNSNIDVSGGYCREFGASFAKDIKTVPLNHNDLVEFSILRCPFIHPTVIFSIEVFCDGNRYPENAELLEDLQFWYVLIEKGYSFANIDKILVDFRISDETLARRTTIKRAYSECKLRYRESVRQQCNKLFILAKLALKLLVALSPSPFVVLAYKKFR